MTCHETVISDFARGWNRVTVEQGLDDRTRPDIVLHAGETAIAAIEIVVSNAVSPDKERALERLGLPWIELAASAGRTVPEGWTITEPVEVLRASGAPWRCVIHAARLLAARVVDVYHDDGARERFIYRVTRLGDENGDALRLQRGGIEIAVVAPASAEHVREAFAADVKKLERTPGSFADSPMHWATGDAAENVVEGALFDRVGRDPTPLATTHPRRWYFASATRRWFLPADMRDVRWDRAPLDIFAAHPAWRNANARVAERPAPEGGWRTPIFAGRPHGAMFGYGWPTRVAGDGLVVVDVSGKGVKAQTEPHRAIVVVEHAQAAGVVQALSRSLEREGVDATWVSHPQDWSPEMAPLAWAAGGRDQRGQGVVLVDDLGVFRGEAFAKAVARNDRRLSGAAIRRAMAGRVERLAGRQQ